LVLQSVKNPVSREGAVKFFVIHEARFELLIEAASEKEAERLVASIPYERWDRSVTVREEYVPVEESPVNPRAGG
jgi:hypothetical protein